MSTWAGDKPRARPCRTCRLDSIDGSLLVEHPELWRVEAWKFGELYRCSNCGRHWFLHEHRRKISRIHDTLLSLAQHWNRSRLVLNTSQLSVLASIGGVVDYYKDYVAIPCSARNVSGQQHHKAIVLVARQPPHFWYEPQMVHWADELISVVPSPFALPLEVRRASREKREESMGFAPVGIVDKQGKEYTLGWYGEFFDKQGIRGEEIRLSGRRKRWREIVRPEPAEAYYFVDWFDRCEGMLVSG